MRRRTPLLVTGWLAALLLLTAAAGLAVQLGSLQAGAAAWHRQDLIAAESHFSRAVQLPLVERWMASYDRGVARGSLQHWDAAADDFEVAARWAPEEAQCLVRLAWSQVLESGADGFRAADDPSRALVRYQQALVVLADVDCTRATNVPDAGGGDAQEQWAQARRRVEQKRSDGAGTWQPPPQTDEADPGRSELDERSRQAQQERQKVQDQQDAPDEGRGNGERTW